MKALDTNVIIRFLVNDDKEQGQKARELLEAHEKNGSGLFLSIPVLLETLYVLDSVYGYSREDIVRAIEMLTSMSVLVFERIDAVNLMLNSKNTFELEDMLIGAVALDAECSTTLTFDKKASKSEFFELVK